MNRSLVLAAVLALGLGVLPEPADAQTRPRLVFEETIIEGEVRKPEVAVYITRQNLHDRYQLELKETFLRKIVESVDSAPF